MVGGGGRLDEIDERCNPEYDYNSDSISTLILGSYTKNRGYQCFLGLPQVDRQKYQSSAIEFQDRLP